MLVRREIENYLFDKETLRNYAVSKGVAFNEMRYDGVVNDIQNQDLKLIQQQIQHSVNFTGNIDDFKKELRIFISKGGVIYNDLKSCIF
jgi:argininosuccinate synthase